MQERTISKNGLTVSDLGLGCMAMSEFYGPTDLNESIATLEKAIDLGVTHFDTADVYGFGHNEELVGKVLKPHRDRIILATKFGILRDKDNPMFRGINGHPDYVKISCEQSLKRLNVDVIDLYYAHRMDATIPIEETVGAMADLVKQGKVRYIGLSEAAPDLIRRGHAVHPLAALQTEYSLWTRVVEKEILPLCESLGIGFVAYSPVGRGALTGKLKSLDDLDATDARRYFPRLHEENLAHNLKLIESLEHLAKAKNCTPAQLSLAWLLAQGPHVTAIPGTRHLTYLQENCDATQLHLTPDELALINQNIPAGAAKGDRYPPDFMKEYQLDE